MRLSKESPSTFATLLRRSKFASYDPQIAQVYTTFGGHASRGNWGLKRPLTLTKRDTYRTITSVDSREQQTEWNHAEHPVRWLRVANELGKEPLVYQEDGEWWDTLGCELKSTYDSEYTFKRRPSQPPFSPLIHHVTPGGVWKTSDQNRSKRSHRLNTSAMSPQEFDKHLDWIRKLQPKFKQFVSHRAASKKASPHKTQNSIQTLRSEFFTSRIEDDFRRNTHAARLWPHPHHNAGFSYARTSDLTNRFLHNPVPARILTGGKQNMRHKATERITVCVGGMVGSSTKQGLSGWRQIPLSNLEQQDVPLNIRATHLLLRTPPKVISPPDGVGFSNARVEMQVTEDGRLLNLRTNPHPPGSQKYIAHEPPNKKTRMTSPSEKVYRRSGSRYGNESKAGSIAHNFEVLNAMIRNQSR